MGAEISDQQTYCNAWLQISSINWLELKYSQAKQQKQSTQQVQWKDLLKSVDPIDMSFTDSKDTVIYFNDIYLVFPISL